MLNSSGKRGTQLKVTLIKEYDDTTFQNFSSLIIDMAKRKRHGFGECSVFSIGGHVAPYYHCCAHCDVDYDVIGSTEDFANDFEFITRRANLSKIRGQQRVVHNKADGSLSEKNKTKKKSQVLVENVFPT